MQNIHDVVLTTIYARMRADRAQLETEESGKIISMLQGRISGYNLLLEQMKENIPFLSFVDNEDEEVNPHDMEDRDLVVLSMGLITDRAYWDPIEKSMKYEVAQDKHYLYYDAKKPRSLDVIHGKRDGMLLFKDIFSAIKQEIESRREEEPLFKDELENEDMNLDLFNFETDEGPEEEPEEPAEYEEQPAETDAVDYEQEEGFPVDEFQEEPAPYEVEQEATGLDDEYEISEYQPGTEQELDEESYDA